MQPPSGSTLQLKKYTPAASGPLQEIGGYSTQMISTKGTFCWQQESSPDLEGSLALGKKLLFQSKAAPLVEQIHRIHPKVVVICHLTMWAELGGDPCRVLGKKRFHETWPVGQLIFALTQQRFWHSWCWAEAWGIRAARTGNLRKHWCISVPRCSCVGSPYTHPHLEEKKENLYWDSKSDRGVSPLSTPIPSLKTGFYALPFPETGILAYCKQLSWDWVCNCLLTSCQ